MTGTTLGVAAPASPTGAITRPFYRVPASTRTRRLQGVCMAGDLLLSVYSSRQAGEPLAVSIALQDTYNGERISRITAAQARALAQAFEQAADAAESTTSASRGD